MVVDLLDFESSLAGSLTSSAARVALCVSASERCPSSLMRVVTVGR